MTRRPLLLPALFLALAACQSAPPAAPPRRVVRAPAPPPPAEVEGAWSFGIVGDRCTARIAHREMTLSLTAGPGRKTSLSLSAPGRALPVRSRVRLAFRGEGTGWQLAAQTDAQRTAHAGTALDAAAEGRIRDLLGGGTVSVSGRGVSAPALSVPDAGVSGRDWYACVARLTQE